MSTTHLCLRRMDSTNPWFHSKVLATALSITQRPSNERGPSATERSFPASAGRGCRSRQIARSISFGATATSPFYVRLFPNDVHDAHVPLPGSADKFKSVSDDPYRSRFFRRARRDGQTDRASHRDD